MIDWFKRDSKITKNAIKDARKNTFRVGVFALGFIVLILFSSSPYAWGFGLNEHRGITHNSLWFLRPYVLNKIIEANLEVDYPTIDIAGEHFDACAFDDTSDYIQDGYEGLHPWYFQELPRQFGAILHPIQDFYSHSNWMELGLGGGLLVEHSENWPNLQKWANVNPYENDDRQILIAQDDNCEDESRSY
jgi:hypothetical protein